MQCISLAPDSAPTTKGEGPSQDHGASNYVTGREKMCGFLAVRYLEVIILRGLIGFEQSVRYSELRGCPLLGGSYCTRSIWQIQSASQWLSLI